jgi:hypothetical protein
MSVNMVLTPFMILLVVAIVAVVVYVVTADGQPPRAATDRLRLTSRPCDRAAAHG